MSNCEDIREANDERFYKLANKLDDLLKHFNNNIYIINNSNIHLPRNHPEYLYIWKPVIYQKFTKATDLVRITLLFLFLILKSVLKILSDLLKKNKKKLTKIACKNIDYIFISHQLGEEIGDYDFYYGDILSKLSTYNNDIIRLLISHKAPKATAPMSKIYQSIFLDTYINRLSILKYVINNIKSTFLLIVFCQKNNYNYYETLSIIVGQIENFNNYKLTLNLESIICQYKIKNLVMTFEGNTIERSIFYLCSKYNIKSFGYQHAPIIKSQNSIFREITCNLSPNVILASGPYTLMHFQQRLPHDISVRLLGSPKLAVYQGSKAHGPKNYRTEILLVPDGNIESVIRFCNIGRGLANKNGQLQLKIRAHPLFQEILDKQMCLLDKITNFSVSDKKLEDDLENSFWVIYENSSVAIQALFYYCKMIYLDNPLANVDPLFDLHRNKYSALNVSQIYSIIQDEIDSRDSDSISAYRFAEEYFSSLDYQVFY